MQKTQAQKLNAQIIQSLSLFLMYHGYKLFSISFLETDALDTFTINMPRMDEQLIELIATQIHQERESSIESYYFELLGDLDREEDLELLGLFIDDMQVLKTNESITITLYRKK